MHECEIESYVKELLLHREAVPRNCIKCCMMRCCVNEMYDYDCVEIYNCVEARGMKLYRKVM